MFDFHQWSAWGKVTGDDPLGFKRDALKKSLTSNSLLDMDLTSNLSYWERIELEGIVNKKGEIDLLGMGYTSFGKKTHERTEDSDFFGISSGSNAFQSTMQTESYSSDDVTRNLDGYYSLAEEKREGLHNLRAFKSIDHNNLFRFNSTVINTFYVPILEQDLAYSNFVIV